MNTISTTIERWTVRLAGDTVGAVAVVLKGSAARGDMEPASDVDFDVLTESPDEERYLSFLDYHDERLLHISVAVRGLESWLAEADEPAGWAFDLPAHETTRLLWAATPQLRAQLDIPYIAHPSGEPELEDTIDALAKISNALARGDDPGVRLAALDIANWMPGLVLPMNEITPPRHRREALDAALGMANVPNGYRDDLLACFGMSGNPTADVAGAARRLVSGVTALMAENAHLYRGKLPRDLQDQLESGLIQAWIDQLS